MEKYRNRIRTRFFKRLLISVLFSACFITLYAQQDTLNQNNFSFILSSDSFSQNEDILFELTLEQIKPEEIQYLPYKWPQGINLRLLRKQEIFSPKGTKIDLWLKFDSPGLYKLDDFHLTIKKNNLEQTINASFPQILINKDLSSESPLLTVCFEDGTTVSSDNIQAQTININKQKSQVIRFSVYAQFTKQILSFEYEIPKDSIFIQTKKYEFPATLESEDYFSDKLIQIADYEWTLLNNKPQSFPLMTMQCINLQNNPVTIELHDFYVESVFEENSDDSQKNNLYEEVFDATSPAIEENSNSKKSETDCADLADRLGKNRFIKILFFTILSVIIITFIFIIFILRYKSNKLISIIYFSILVLVFIFSYTTIMKKNKAIFTNGYLYSIPDENAVKTETIQPGTQVKIAEKTNRWYYIQTETAEGWCLKNQLILF